MANQPEIVQSFLDAVADRATFCEGYILTFRDTVPLRMEPNCGVREECPLFRFSGGALQRIWRPGMDNDAEHGCLPYQFLQDWKKSQQRWIVRLDGVDGDIEVQAESAELAVCVAWWEQLRQGNPVDKMVLVDKRYTVREA